VPNRSRRERRALQRGVTAAAEEFLGGPRPFLGAKHQIAEMLKHGGGSVIFTSTFVGYSFAFPGVAAYAASKSGLIA
jgi:NAD(P)-dependent dehydrogenase (short-subunit alcohol dehydrogenase family)